MNADLMSDSALPPETFRIAAKVRGARNKDELALAMASVSALLGFTAWGAYEATGDGTSHVLRMIVGTGPAAWHAHYLARRLYRADPRPRFARQFSQPFFMSEIDKFHLRDQESEFLTEASSFGIAESFVFPLRTYLDRGFAAVLGGPALSLTDNVRTSAAIVASSMLYAAMRLETASLDHVENSILNERQLQCLELVRLGKSSTDIGNILSLSPRTIDAHLAAACDRLDVRTRVQAAAKALSLGILPHRQA